MLFNNVNILEAHWGTDCMGCRFSLLSAYKGIEKIFKQKSIMDQMDQT
jgi:hypothetical protein